MNEIYNILDVETQQRPKAESKSKFQDIIIIRPSFQIVVTVIYTLFFSLQQHIENCFILHI